MYQFNVTKFLKSINFILLVKKSSGWLGGWRKVLEGGKTDIKDCPKQSTSLYKFNRASFG
jgi:hypothetical protein